MGYRLAMPRRRESARPEDARTKGVLKTLQFACLFGIIGLGMATAAMGPLSLAGLAVATGAWVGLLVGAGLCERAAMQCDVVRPTTDPAEIARDNAAVDALVLDMEREARAKARRAEFGVLDPQSLTPEETVAWATARLEREREQRAAGRAV